MTFWTGESGFKSTSGKLLVKFDDAEHHLPLSETCIRSIILPIKHQQYLDFKKYMNMALKYGSCGFSFH